MCIDVVGRRDESDGFPREAGGLGRLPAACEELRPRHAPHLLKADVLDGALGLRLLQ
jgi:hypothetical protein